MKKFFLILLLVLIHPLVIFAESEDEVKAVFIRDGNLWLLKGAKEVPITETGNVSNPQWSFDGNWVLFEKEAPSQFEPNQIQKELWVFHPESGEKKRIFYDGYSPKWAPNRNLVAFQDRGVLNISDLTNFYNIALGVFSFQWLPDGDSFILSSQATLNPDGWTSPVLYKKHLPKNLKEVDMFGNVQPFFEIPKDLQIDNKSVMSINANSFLLSPSKKWISFIVSPTASLSMDSNMLCAISNDGKQFEILDEVIYGVGPPKWAPSKDILAYIAGGGRIVFGFKGKDLKYKDFPVSTSLTPTNFAELNFTWVDNESIITSRVEAKDWSNEFSEHPLPSLYKINIQENKQVKITEGPSGFGDYDPLYVKSLDKLIWYRGTSITDQNRNVWMADKDGSNAKLWLKNIDMIRIFE